MPVRIQIDPNRCAARVMGAWEKQLYALSGQVLQDCNEYCKVDNHGLIDSSEAASQLSKGLLVWDTLYAKRQYWEIQTSLTRGRVWKWCEAAKRKRKEIWRRQGEEGMRKYL